ncbi:helix-turn-helix transcriptional regulator [Paenibacillaceae bacterium WGS1546]|uniref:helix-turn-helix transcriptional regulator n=1 Tax=Cohnella sp. WGS1546 TaxID=3366810 RepID=UPI00372D1394
MKLDRMLGITMELLSRSRVTAAELAAKFEVSVRTIYRDVELINQAGIPVASFTGADGGFELINGYFLAKQHFSVDDLSVIYNLLKGMEGAMGGYSAKLASKLSSLQPALANGRSPDKIIFDMSASDGEKAIVHPLLDAIHRSRTVAFAYMDAAGAKTLRKAEPVKLYWERGVWYLEAFCLTRQAARFFRVSRMSGLDVTDEAFVPRTEVRASEEEEPQGLEVRLRFDLTAQPRVFEQFPGQCVYQGDHIEVNTLFYTREYAVSAILSYGSKVRIVSPDELKHDLMNAIERIRKLYEEASSHDDPGIASSS